MKYKVIKSLDNIRPYLQRDGGDVELVDVNDNGVVTVRLQGACNGCPGAKMTIKNVIQEILMIEVEGVTEVIGI